MLNTDYDKIIEKVKKLMALGNSTNEHEAKLAADKVAEILTKYNLSMQQVDAKKSYEQRKLELKTQRLRREDSWILPLLRDFYFVRPIIKKEYDPSINKRRFINTYVLIGQPLNVAVASYVFDFLYSQYKHLWAQYKKQYNKTSKSKEAYYHGLTHGIKLQLEKQVKRVEQEEGLILVKTDTQLDAFIEDLFKNLKNTKSHSSYHQDQHAANAGIEAGKSLNIRRGLGEKNESERTLELV